MVTYLPATFNTTAKEDRVRMRVVFCQVSAMYGQRQSVRRCQRSHRRRGGESVNIVAICATLSLIAMVFSWITMATRNWMWYVPTVLFAAASLSLSCAALFL